MNAIVRRLGNAERWLAAEIVLRSCGAVLLGLCMAAVLWLHRSVNQLPLHPLRLLEAFAAVAAIYGWCFGWPLLILGQRLFVRVPVPRWQGHLTM
jgi:hypothetical protein